MRKARHKSDFGALAARGTAIGVQWDSVHSEKLRAAPPLVGPSVAASSKPVWVPASARKANSPRQNPAKLRLVRCASRAMGSPAADYDSSPTSCVHRSSCIVRSLQCLRGLPHIQQLHGVGVRYSLPTSLASSSRLCTLRHTRWRSAFKRAVCARRSAFLLIARSIFKSRMCKSPLGGGLSGGHARQSKAGWNACQQTAAWAGAVIRRSLFLRA